jgi:lauroyl-KDO2-lipid IV(A) myristoyltransferase
MAIETPKQYRYRFQLVLLHPHYWLTWLGLIAFFMVTLLPESFTDWLGGRLGMYAAKKNSKRFSIAKKNLSLCFAHKSDAEIEEMVYAHFQAQFRSLVHYYILWWRPESVVRNKIQTTGFEQIAQYQQQGKNIILLLPHNVGLEFSVAAISMDNIAIGPFKSMRNPVIDWIVAKGRMRFSDSAVSHLFTREDGLRPLLRETRAGKVLIYLADEDLGIDNAVFAPFFGVQKATIPVLGRLAKLTDAVVLPCVSCYDIENRRYNVSLLPAIENLPSGDDSTDTVLMNQAMERAIEYCPVQYLWTLRYFQTRPPGEKSVYD